MLSSIFLDSHLIFHTWKRNRYCSFLINQGIFCLDYKISERSKINIYLLNQYALKDLFICPQV